MNKFPLLAFLAFFSYILSVNAAPAYNIVDDFVNITQQAGGTASGSLTINNTGTTKLNINFTGYGLTKGNDKLSITSFDNITNMNNGTFQISTFSVVVPKQQIPGLYTGTLTTSSNASAAGTDAVAIRLNVTEKYDASATPSQIDLGATTLNSTHIGKIFNVTNIGNANISNVTFGFSADGFNLKSNNTNFLLEFNKTETILFNITIPGSSSTGNITLGGIKVVAPDLTKELLSVIAQVGGGLIIEDLDVFLTTRLKHRPDGTQKSENGNDLDVPDGRKLNFGGKNVGPGSVLRFNFNIENTFTDDEDIDINDAIVKVTIEEIDDGDDIEEESHEFDLNADADEEVDIIINVPISVDVGIYEIIIEVAGEDDDGNSHTDEMKLKVDVDKEGREVIVKEARLFPEVVKCSGTSTLTATIKNIGSRAEDEAKIEIVNSDLGINFVKRSINLEEDPFDSDNEFTQNLLVNVARTLKPGTYPIVVRSYLQDNALWEMKSVDLIVNACGGVDSEDQEPQPEEENGVIEELIQTDEGDGQEATGSRTIPVLGPTSSTEVPLTKKPGFWVGIVLVNVIVIGGVVFFIVKAVGKK
jgi:hypothetical protein